MIGYFLVSFVCVMMVLVLFVDLEGMLKRLRNKRIRIVCCEECGKPLNNAEVKLFGDICFNCKDALNMELGDEWKHPDRND